MILSNIDIQDALDRGWLKIEPEPSPRFPTADRECPYQTSAVDLRLGGEIVRFKSDLPVAIDLRERKFHRLAEAIATTWSLDENDQPFVLGPNELVLAKTLERVSLPIAPEGSGAPCLAARIEGRSSYSRCGLLVHFTAPTIHSGFDGTITLEIINFGPYSIQLRKNCYICQLIVEQVSGRPFKNDSQFQGQSSPGGVQ